MKSESIHSEDMRLGMDTSHGEWGDNFVRNRTPFVMYLFVEKGQWPFSTVLKGFSCTTEGKLVYYTLRFCVRETGRQEVLP